MKTKFICLVNVSLFLVQLICITSFEMMKYCKDNSIDTIVVENTDRLARDLITMETAFMYLTSKLGYNLISVANPETFLENTPTQTIIRQILGAISQFEKSQIVEKLKGARERKSKLNILLKTDF